MSDSPAEKIGAGPAAGSSTPSAAQADQRASDRYPFVISAEVTEASTGARLSARTSDLGLRGCYIDMLNPFARGTTVQVRLTREKKSFEAEGTVAHSQPGMGMGVAFTAISPDQLEVLRNWLGEVTGESSPLETSPAEAAARRPPQQKELRILNKLISLMMSKRLLSESEGEELLRDLSR